MTKVRPISASVPTTYVSAATVVGIHTSGVGGGGAAAGGAKDNPPRSSASKRASSPTSARSTADTRTSRSRSRSTGRLPGWRQGGPSLHVGPRRQQANQHGENEERQN